MNNLRNIIGLVVERIGNIHDYLQIIFSDEVILNIYNNYSYDGSSVNSIKGKKIVDITEEEARITFKFEGGSSLVIGMKNSDYNSPEAMELIKKNSPTIVWS